MDKLTDDQVKAILEDAFAQAGRVTAAYLQECQTEYPCGFAWVRIRPARGQFVKVLKELKLGKKAEVSGGFLVTNPSKNPTQNMEAKMAGARVFVAHLRKYGVNAAAEQRID